MSAGPALARLPTRPRSRTIADSALVLGDRPLRPGVIRSATSRFRDMVWDLSPAIFRKDGAKLALNFSRVPERFRQVTKELFYALLADEPLPGHRQLRMETIRGYFSHVVGFLAWAEARGVRSLSALTATDLTAYQEHLLKRKDVAAAWHVRSRYVVRLFWVYRSKLSTDRLALDPNRLEAWEDENRHAGRRENRIQRIPEAALGPLLGWALRWVDEFADDVIRANDEWRALHVNTEPNRGRWHPPPVARGEVPKRLQMLLDRYRAERRPLPQGLNDTVNLAHLARELGCGHRSLATSSVRAQLEEAVRDVGLADGTWLRAEIRGQLNGRPWRSAIGYMEAPELARQLQTACYIVIAYLSGMRDIEVKHLRRGCLATRRDNTGRVYRWTVTSKAFKGESTPEGVEATWVVGEPVRRAIAALERLLPHGQELLFAHLPGSRYFRRERRNQARLGKQTRYDLASFVEWVNTACDTQGLPDRIPLVNGQHWRLTTSQFRRTLAWFIARRPGGVIAGAIAYRHQSVQMFEGYAGTSASGFRAEVEAEQALERGEQLLAMVEAYEHRQLAGPAAGEAATRLEEFRHHAQAGFAGTVVSDERRLQLIMRRHDPHVYHGKFVTCVHNRDRALCRRPDDDGHGPVLPDCKPLACRNVALTAANLAAWREHLARLDQALASADVLAPYLRHRLGEQHEQIARFLAEHDQHSKGST